MSKISRGPWKTERVGDASYGVFDADGKGVASIAWARNAGGEPPTALSNATAISAVPDMLEALERLTAWTRSKARGDAPWELADAAIAKAKGGAA